MANSLPVREQALEILIDCQAAAYGITWLFEKYDAGDHAQALEVMRLIAPLIKNKLSDAMALVESFGQESKSGVKRA